MNAFLNQLVQTPHGVVMAKATALAAIGIGDREWQKLRSQLTEGDHYLYSKEGGIRKLYFTQLGLIELAELVGSDRAIEFSKSLTAIAHQPRQYPAQQVRPMPMGEPVGMDYYQPAQPQQPSQLSQAQVNEIIQLRRDELELKRSQEETRRLELVQRLGANHPQMPMPQGSTYRKVEKTEIVIVNQVSDRGVRFLSNDAFLGAIVCLFYLISGLTVCTIVSALLTPRPVEVHRYVR
jgi:hypothetical protein